MTTASVLVEVRGERDRQERLCAAGRFAHTCAAPGGLSDLQRLAVLVEELGEVAREVLGLAGLVAERGAVARLRGELVQVSAVAVAWVEGIDAEATA